MFLQDFFYQSKGKFQRPVEYPFIRREKEMNICKFCSKKISRSYLLYRTLFVKQYPIKCPNCHSNLYLTKKSLKISFGNIVFLIISIIGTAILHLWKYFGFFLTGFVIYLFFIYPSLIRLTHEEEEMY
jgi:CXXC-20-CXXC protein